MSDTDGFETVYHSPPKRKNKYGAKKTFVDGVAFDSKAEARRYGELKLLLHGGLIADLELQPKFPIHVNGKKIGFYKADFQYREVTDDHITIEDVKGHKTPVYKLKKKLVEAIYGIEIVEVKA